MCRIFNRDEILTPPPPLPPPTTTRTIQVHVALKGKKLEHQGIRVEFVGQIEMFYDRGNHHDFLSLVRQLDPPGLILLEDLFKISWTLQV